MSKTRESDDAISMDRTRRDVQKAMQAVHDMPVEETVIFTFLLFIPIHFQVEKRSEERKKQQINK